MKQIEKRREELMVELGEYDIKFCRAELLGDELSMKKMMDVELLKIQKLKSLQLFSGGIAHDFNNILTTMLGTISLLEMKMGPADELYRYISVLMNATNRACDLTKQLLNFSKDGKPEKKTTCVKELIGEAAEFGSKGSNIKYVQDVPDDLWFADVDYGQIVQVLHNLVINAGQAMPDGGTVRLLAANETICDLDPVALDPGRYVKIAVVDEGTGIKDENINKIFDPYFTTKEKGTGLGLVSAYSIIKKHGGLLAVESEYGRGTTFLIYLLASESEAKGSEPDEDLWLTTKGNVLVMDDDESIREFLKEALMSLGYNADLAKEGSEAIDKYVTAKASGHPFDAILMDITIPGGMGAKDTIDRLIKIDPKVKAIVSSGYPNDPIMVEFHKYGFKGTVDKPYTYKGLSQKLKDVLEG